MASKTNFVDPKVMDYIGAHSLREAAVLADLRAETAKLPEALMQVPPEQGQFLALLVQAIGATRCLEIGTFTGYSALAIAQALPPSGELVACDASEEWTGIARRYWEEAGVAERVTLKLGDAVETLDRLLAEEGEAGFDFAFVDADKENYDAYYERALDLTRTGGLIVFDNMLWGGSVADGRKRDPDTLALKALNAKLHDDKRVDLSLLYIGDGVTLARKR